MEPHIQYRKNCKIIPMAKNFSRRDSSLSINPIPEEELEDDNLGFCQTLLEQVKRQGIRN